MLYVMLCLFSAAIVVVDQLVKLRVVETIALGAQTPGIPGLFHFTHVQNTGASFSMFSGYGWLFVVVLVVFIALLPVLIRKKILSRPVELWCLFAILGGGVGNAIDRILHGYVVDMIEVEFMQFAVFNVADIFITCGCIALALVILFDKPKKEEAHEA